MIKHIVIMRGLPGSGKSFRTKEILEEIKDKNQGNNIGIFSTDNYWIRPDGQYDWNPRLVGDAHMWNFACFSRFIDYNHEGFDSYAIIDNTNIKFGDFHQYVELGINKGWTWQMAESHSVWRYDVEICAEKNIHKVPLQSIQNMKNKWQSISSVISILKDEEFRSYKSIFEE